ncbi:hypothetical protein GBF38_005936 [Nibea albiflora]|uniref:Uncharacterized protein n=1 Tax=Nibea albiflora TaxID=240163 RepID=A0ACB7FBF7_NIBAL|nr:hypothetical protein GBF38_005936 [Nibea albiflora]
MDERPRSPTSSTDSLTPEINTIPVSGVMNHTPLDNDELMRCDDLLDQEELACSDIQETRSLESISLLSGSWSCSTDSVVSEVAPSFVQDVNKVIEAVCHSFLFPENMETESVDSEEEQDETTSTSSIGSEESLPSSSTATPITRANEKWHREEVKVHPAPLGHLNAAVRSPSTDWTIFCTTQSKQGPSQGTTTIASSSPANPDLKPIQRTTKSNRFLDFFRNIFSKKNKKKKMASEEKHSSGLLFGCTWCFGLDQDQPQPLA